MASEFLNNVFLGVKRLATHFVKRPDRVVILDIKKDKIMIAVNLSSMRFGNEVPNAAMTVEEANGGRVEMVIGMVGFPYDIRATKTTIKIDSDPERVAGRLLDWFMTTVEKERANMRQYTGSAHKWSARGGFDSADEAQESLQRKFPRATVKRVVDGDQEVIFHVVLKGTVIAKLTYCFVQGVGQWRVAGRTAGRFDDFSDFGWANDWKGVPSLVEKCLMQRHPLDDVDVSNGRDIEHRVRCEKCRFVYRYDCSS